MTTDGPDDPAGEAVQRLQELGLSAYAARTYVALARIGTGTARDVADAGDVPRTRVYDAVDELRTLGLVDVEQSSPKVFAPVSVETLGRTFERETARHTAALRDAVGDLEPERHPGHQDGVWTVTGQSVITERVLDLIEGAEEEVVYMTVEELLTEALVDALAAAADRGLTVRLGGVSSAVQEEIRSRVPGVETFDSMWVWSDTPAGRIAMVDRQKTLASALVNGTDAARGAPRSETAIWGSGETNSLVVVLRAMFTWRLDGPGAD